MSLKSLRARLNKIPDPDLSRLRQEVFYEKLKLLTREQLEELRQLLLKHDEQKEEGQCGAATPPRRITTGEAAKAAVTRPTRRRPRGSKEDKGK
jgi:hypothetical protein